MCRAAVQVESDVELMGGTEQGGEARSGEEREERKARWGSVRLRLPLSAMQVDLSGLAAFCGRVAVIA